MADTPVFDLQKLHVFFGAASQAEARIYARLSVANTGHLRLQGRVTGPVCHYSHTLSASVALVDRGPGPALLAEAILPDPCFWTPELPMLYRVDVELTEGGRIIAATQRTLGIRPLGVAGRRLVFEARAWVLRGVCRTLVPDAALEEWRAAGAALFADDPDDALLAEASRLGILVVAKVSAPQDASRLARWPAAAVAVVAADPGDCPNLLAAEHFGPGLWPSPAAWARAVVLEASDVDDIVQRARSCSLPVLVHRPLGAAADLASARAACDVLQRELAGRGDFAGYLV